MSVSVHDIVALPSGKTYPGAAVAVTTIDPFDHDPVSYTHLDVYKRQQVYSAPGWMTVPCLQVVATVPPNRLMTWVPTVSVRVISVIGSVLAEVFVMVSV